jgi:branched-chain amino acid transport system ATP-binding protein
VLAADHRPETGGGRDRTGRVLRLQGVTVPRGGRDVVRDVSLEIPQGEVTTLLGPNGAGKSSLLLAVAGVLRPTAGSINVDGTELMGRRPEKVRGEGVAVVPEGRRLLPGLSVQDNLVVATYALSRQDAAAGRNYALDLFPELTKRLDLRARSLSGGEQQMLVLAQALVSRPRFLLIDELSLGLAPIVVKRLVPRIRTVVESGTGVLLIEQFAIVALELANRAYIMRGGTIRFSGLASELKADPQLLHSAYLTPGEPTPGHPLDTHRPNIEAT